jgi:trans-aconitate methyltransferase
MAELSGSIFDASLVESTLPLVPGMVEKLKSGADVADVGTGRGHAVNVMAKAFPNSHFFGLDFSEEALAVGRQEAAAWGLTNATFKVQDAAKLDGDVDVQGSSYVVDAVHDQADPHCMTVSLAYDGVDLGAMWGVQKAREIFERAGFDQIDIHNVPGDILNNYYVCHKAG